MTSVNLLDKGFIELIDQYGTDLTIVNAARVSFGKRKENLDESDEKLIKYLINNKHFSPFRHAHVQFHLKAPEYVMRQWYKHVIGCEYTTYTEKDHAWNEISGRYVEYIDILERSPDSWRLQSKSSKQGSEGLITDPILSKLLSQRRAHLIEQIRNHYEFEIEKGVAKEIAREVMPLATYTEVIWTASFQAIMNFIELRDDAHAQYEIRLYAQALKDIMLSLFPVSAKIWITQNNTDI